MIDIKLLTATRKLMLQLSLFCEETWHTFGQNEKGGK